MTNIPDKWNLRRVQINSGGYDSEDRYWGVGEPLYEAFNSEERLHVRARSRAQAKSKILVLYPTARFYQ